LPSETLSMPGAPSMPGSGARLAGRSASWDVRQAEATRHAGTVSDVRLSSGSN
jgi:hypothetical protein